MELTPGEERVLSGEEGPTRAKMMEILVALGRVFGAERLIPIRSAQVSGASYKTIGPYGLEWIESLDARAAVPAVVNPIGMPRDRWREMGIDRNFARKQEQVVLAYERLGIRLDCTCTPYYLNITEYGDHIAWSESSAVAYANSVIGARTNREGGPGALAAAIIGKTPDYGLHRLENRRPTLAIEVDPGLDLSDPALYGALGYVAGKQVGNRIPLFTGIRPTKDQLKALGAAMAATGAVALFHVDGITPEARIFHFSPEGLERVPVGGQDIRAALQEIPVEAVALGCPHCSDDELATVAGLLAGKTVRIPVYVFASRGVITRNEPLIRTIERSGARVYADTCMVVSPALDQYGSIMVNSGKALAYVPTMCGAAARLGTTAECITVATS